MSSDALVNKQESGTNYSAVVPSDHGEVYEKVSEDDARALMTDVSIFYEIGSQKFINNTNIAGLC